MAERAHPPFLNYQPAICRAGGGRKAVLAALSPRPRGSLPRQRCAQQAAPGRAAPQLSLPEAEQSRQPTRTAAHGSARQMCPELGPLTLPPLFFRQFVEDVRTSRYRCARVVCFVGFFFFFSTVFTIFKAFPYVIKPGTLVYL